MPVVADAETTAHASQGTPNHTVRAGETIYDIAARYHVSPAALLSRNHLSAQAFIQPGQKLRVPGRTASTSPSQTTSKPARSGSTRSYVVRSGDTLTGIAARHHMSLARLAKLNGISSKEFIHAGTTLKVTGSTTSTSPATHAKKKTTATKKKNNTFAGRTYSDAIVDAAHRNRSTLAGRAVPSRAETKAKITRISRQHGLDPSIALAISYQESGWDQRQVSVANAVGAMQVIPSTGEWTSQLAGRQLDLLDTDDNITAGVLLLKVLTEQADSTSEAIAGYYQGLASVESNGMYGDTKQYVQNVKALRRRM
jgi:LysM repeat protein